MNHYYIIFIILSYAPVFWSKGAFDPLYFQN